MDQQISTKEINQLASLVNRDKFPNTFDYLLLHGLTAAISPYNLTGSFKSTEEVYKECLKRGVKWEDIIKLPSKGIIL